MKKSSFERFIIGKHVLVLEGYARQCLPFMQEFKKMGMEVTLLCNSILDCGYVSRFADHKIIGKCDPDNYVESEKYIVNLVKNGKFDVVFPLVDFSAGILANHKEELSKYAVICTNDKDIFNKCNDKLEVMKICMDNGIPCPYTLFNIKSISDIIESKINFPIVIKPRRGCGARGFHKIENQKGLYEIVDQNNINLEDYVVQECIPINSLAASANMFIDKDGEIKSSFLYGCQRVYPLKGGTGTCDFTFDNSDVQDSCARLAKIMRLRGINGIDMMIDSRDNVAKIIEINPRPLACSKIGFISGVNQARQIIEYAFGYPVTPYKSYKSDMRVRMMQIDVLWFIKSPERFSAKPSWFSWKNTVDQTFSWKDPLPWFAFLLKGLLNLKKEEEKRK